MLSSSVDLYFLLLLGNVQNGCLLFRIETDGDDEFPRSPPPG
jgi:hypothetical protein